ncbi:hypothetical protein HDU86_000770 [Geranomyces michiganensis]|nr:hypothetical protein HDU86_000770 [Geranomyces michiganensis]
MRTSFVLVTTLLAAAAGAHGRAAPLAHHSVNPPHASAIALESSAPELAPAIPSKTGPQPTHVVNIPKPAHPVSSPALAEPADPALPTAAPAEPGEPFVPPRWPHRGRPAGGRNPDHGSGSNFAAGAPAGFTDEAPTVSGGDANGSILPVEPQNFVPAAPAAAPIAVAPASNQQSTVIQPAAVAPAPLAAAPAPVAETSAAQDPRPAAAPVAASAPQIAVAASSKKSSVPLAPVAAGVGIACVVALVAAGLVVRKRRATVTHAGVLPYNGGSGFKGTSGGDMSGALMNRTYARDVEPFSSRDVSMAYPAAELPAISAYAAGAAPFTGDESEIERAVTDVFQRHQPIPVEHGWHEQASIAPYLAGESAAASHGDSMYSNVVTAAAVRGMSTYSAIETANANRGESMYSAYADMPPSETVLPPVDRAASPMTTDLPLVASEGDAHSPPEDDLSYRDSFVSNSSIASWYGAAYASDPSRLSGISSMGGNETRSVNTFGKAHVDAEDVKHTTLMNALNHIGSHAAGGHSYWDDDMSDLESSTTIRPSNGAYDTATLQSRDTSGGQSFATATESFSHE